MIILKNILLDVKNLEVQFKTGSIVNKAVNGVTFEVFEGENLGIVGESGSGKSVTANALMGLIPSPPGKVTNGDIKYKGTDLSKLSEKEWRKYRGNEIAMIFQDASTSLNPVFKVGNQIVEGIMEHQKVKKTIAKEKAIELLKMVGIPEPEKRLNMYPHEFSGGMKQRVMIAIALSSNPNLLIADEPTTALDVTVQSQILDLIKKLQDEIDMSVIMITHDLGVVWETCDKIIIMYAGRVMESGTVKDIYENPYHPYTWGLLDAQISKNQNHDEPLRTIKGSPPDLSLEFKGCPFNERCPFASDICFEETPKLESIKESHKVACHFQTPVPTLTRGENL